LNSHSSQPNHLPIYTVGALKRNRHENQNVQAEDSSPKVEDNEELIVSQVISDETYLVIRPAHALSDPYAVIYC
jgi:hypothetical protein